MATAMVPEVLNRKTANYSLLPHNTQYGKPSPYGANTMAPSSKRPSRMKISVWQPFSLRKTTILLLVAVLLFFVTALELINWRVNEMQGLTIADRVSAQALQYVPTVLAILIGFAWKSLSSDLVLVTPWAAMSGKWVSAKHSILLNYADSLDFVSVWVSFRNGHWALCLILICGLLSGILTPLANSLTFADLAAGVNKTAPVRLANDFIFNGSLGITPGWHSAELWQNYITAAGDDVVGVNQFSWLSGGHAYPAFDTDGIEGSIITGTVDAFSASLECNPVTYQGSYQQLGQNSTFILNGQNNSYCDLPISQAIIWPWNSSTISSFTQNSTTGYRNVPPSTWLNITQCGNDPTDFRILATSLVVNIPNNLTSLPYANLTSAPYANKTSNSTNTTINVWTSQNIGVKAAGFVCSPSYWRIPSLILANATTGLIGVGPYPVAAPKRVDNVGVSLDVIEAAMNNPIDTTSQSVFQAAATNSWSLTVLPNSYNWSQFSQLKVMQRKGWIYLYKGAASYYQPPTDPFFSATVGDNQTAWNVFNNQSMLKNIVESRFATFVPMLANVAARAPTTSTVPGAVYFSVPKLFIRSQILRALEAILLVLAVVALIILSLARPFTFLREHPGSLNYIVRLLANSPMANEVLAGLGPCDEKQLKKHLENNTCRLSLTENDEVQLELCHPFVGEPSLSEPSARKHEGSESFLMMPNNQSSIPQRQITDIALDSGTRYRPLALRFGSRILISFALIAVVIVAGVSLYISNTHGGYRTSTASTFAWDLVPSVILVVIGYSVQSMEHAALGLATYSQLAANSFRSRYAMVRRQIQDASKAIITNKTYDWSFVSIPCVVLFLTFPALKLMAGKLFVQTYGTTTVLSSFPANVSQLERFNNLSSYVPFSTAAAYADSWQQTLFTQNAISRPVDIYFDKVGPLYLGVIDYNISTLLDGPPQTVQSDLLESRLMAINTSVTCSAVDPAGLGLFLENCNQNLSYYTFKYDCVTPQCKAQLGGAFSEFNVTVKVTPGLTDQGISMSPYFSATYPSLQVDSLSVFIADFTPLGQAGFDYSQLKCDNKSIDPSLLGKYMPSIRAVNCTRQLNLVHANVTFTRWDKVKAATPQNKTGDAKTDGLVVWTGIEKVILYSPKQQWGWTPQSYDPKSVDLIAPVIAPGEYPAPIIVPDGGYPYYHTGTTPTPLLSPYTFSGLLQQVQELRTGNQLDLLDVRTLMSTTQYVYESFTMGALEETFGNLYYGGISSAIPKIAPKVANYTAKFTLYKPAVKQEMGFTAALIALLLVSFFAVALLSISMPRSTLLPKAPNSIAAQMSILAGSNLVSLLQRARETGQQADVFDKEIFGLGWWPLRNGETDVKTKSAMSSEEITLLPQENYNFSDGYRWGVDIGYLEKDDRKLRSRAVTRISTLNNDSSYDTSSARHSFFHRNSSNSLTTASTLWGTQKKGPRVTTTSYESVPSLIMDESDTRPKGSNSPR